MYTLAKNNDIDHLQDWVAKRSTIDGKVPRFISPLRYPGGKSWLVPVIRKWIGLDVRTLIEPFAGGASVSLACLAGKQVNRIVLVELDPNVAALWKTILSSQHAWLLKKISEFKPTLQNLETELATTSVTTRDRAWQTLLLNRFRHGGIITALRSGFINAGERKMGVASRWYPETLRNRIIYIHNLRSQISFKHESGMPWLADPSKATKEALYIDPPYPAAGKRLYECWDVEHKLLFASLTKLNRPFLASYEDTLPVRKLAQEHQLHCYPVNMHSRLHAKKGELLIGQEPSITRLPK